jgi:translation initiation factor 1 (eIF-1/SUI1)
LPGKNAGEEVMVQGKQLDAVAKLLMQKGVPKTHIKLEGSRDNKKK